MPAFTTIRVNELAVAVEALEDPIAPHPDEVTMIIPVGTVVVFNAYVWHGATANPKRIDRPNCTSFWARRIFPKDAADQTGIDLADDSRMVNRLSQDAYDRLSEPARCLFDPPEASENDGRR